MAATLQRDPTISIRRPEARSRPLNWPAPDTGERDRPHRQASNPAARSQPERRASSGAATKTVRVVDAHTPQFTRRALALLLAAAASVAALTGTGGLGDRPSVVEPVSPPAVEAPAPAEVRDARGPASRLGACLPGQSDALPFSFISCWSDPSSGRAPVDS